MPSPARSFLQLRLAPPPRVGVERGQRLVEEQHRRVARERARERDPLALAARELATAAPARGARSGTARAARRRGAVAAPKRRSARTVEVREERVLLEDVARRARRSGGRSMRRSVSSQRLARRRAIRPASGREQPGDRAQHGRLARARRPDERDVAPSPTLSSTAATKLRRGWVSSSGERHRGDQLDGRAGWRR